MAEIEPLDTRLLFRGCDPALLEFETTAELSEAMEIVDQSRAMDAIGFGIDIKRPGYNLFVLGEPGSGRHSAVRRMLETKAAGEPAPSDWCYVNNFTESNMPRLLRLPPGRGAQIKKDMQQFVTELAKAIAAVYFGGEDRMVRLDMSEWRR